MALSTKFYILNPFHGLLHRIPRQWLAIRYFKAFKRWPSNSHPQLFHEKVFWLLNNTPQNRQGRLADKYAVRSFLEEKGLGDILTELYGVYKNADEIDFDRLPKQYVIKTNNGCTTNIIVRDNAAINPAEIRRQMSRWLKIHFGDLTGERQYSLIEPLIIAEELLIEDGDPSKPLTDWKFDCFAGEPHFCSIYSDRREGSHEKSVQIVDMDFRPVEDACAYSLKHITRGQLSERPECWERMKEIARELSQGFEYVRVDLYLIDGKPRFSELSFSPGVDTDYTPVHQRRLGELIHLPTDI